VQNIGRSPWLVQPLSAPAGAGKTTALRALASAGRRFQRRVLVLAPTGKAVDVAVCEGAGEHGYTIAKALQSLHDNKLQLNRQTLVVVDEAAMVGTGDLRQILTATTQAGAKTVLVGDSHQLAPVKARGGMFAQLCTDTALDTTPWGGVADARSGRAGRFAGPARRRSRPGAAGDRLVPPPRPAAVRGSGDDGLPRPKGVSRRHWRRIGCVVGV
jgi:AAA domain